MSRKINKLSKTNKLAVASLLLIALTNPWSAGYIGYGVEIIVKYFTLYSHIGFAVGLIGIVAVTIFNIATTNKLNIPEKGKKNKLSRQF